MASIWRKNTLLYLSLDNICSSKLTDFFELRSRKTARFSENCSLLGTNMIKRRQITKLIIQLEAAEGNTERILCS